MLSLLRLARNILFCWSALLISMASADHDNFLDPVPFVPRYGMDGWKTGPTLKQVFKRRHCSANEAVCEQIFARKACGVLVHYTEQCSAYNSSTNWMDSCYCGEGKILREGKNLCCQFRNQLVNWTDVMLTQHTLHLLNATNLQMHLRPKEVRVLYVFNSTNVNITTDSDRYIEPDSTFGAVNSSGPNVPPFENILLHNSNFQAMTNPNENSKIIPPSIKRISLEQSDLDVMEDIRIYGVGKYLGYPKDEDDIACVKANGTRIDLVSKVSLKCSMQINNGDLSRISQLQVNNFTMKNSYIGTIFPKGLYVRGDVKLDNVRIGYLHRGAVHGAGVHLNNVIVDHCDEPCLLFSTAASLTNITVNGALINPQDNSGFLDISTNLGHNHRFTLKEPECSKMPGDVMMCGRIPRRQATSELYTMNRDLLPYHVKVVNHPNLLMVERGCHHSMELLNIKGSFFPSYFFSGCSVPLFVNITNSNLTKFVSGEVDGFLASGSTNIDFLNIVNSIRNFTALDVRVGEIYNVTFSRKVPERFDYFRGSIGVIRKLRLLSPAATFSNTSITKIENFIVDYADGIPNEQLTIIEHSEIGEVSRNGITVEAGTLMLNNVTFREFSPEMIRLGLHGKVILHNLDMKIQDICAFNRIKRPIFSAYYKHQVMVLDSLSPSWLSNCIAFSPPPSACFSPKPASLVADFICLDPSTHCKSSSFRALKCDVSSIRKPIVVGNSPALNAANSIEIIGSRSLTFGEHCMTLITLKKCRIKHMETYPWPCPFGLKLIYSVIWELKKEIQKLSLDHSKVDTLDLALPYLVQMKRSSVNQLTLSNASKVIIRSSTVKRFKKVSFTKLITVLDATIDVIENVVVSEGSVMSISNTTLGLLNRSAISVYGTLTIDNVTLMEQTVGGIWIARGGEVKCTNLKTPTPSATFKIFEWEDTNRRYEEVCAPLYLR